MMRETVRLGTTSPKPLFLSDDQDSASETGMDSGQRGKTNIVRTVIREKSAGGAQSQLWGWRRPSAKLTDSREVRPTLELTEREGFQSHQDHECHHDEDEFGANDPDSPGLGVLLVEPENAVQDEDGDDEPL